MQSQICNCDLSITSVVQTCYLQPGLDGCYDRIPPNDRVSTERFTVRMENSEVVCPRHHPFFVFWAGIVHTTPERVRSQVRHAWIHWPSKTIRILLTSCNNDQIGKGLHKAWRLFTNSAPEDNTTAVAYYTDLGIYECTDYRPDDDVKGDGWALITQIPSFWK